MVVVLVTASVSTKFCCKEAGEGEPTKGANVDKKCIYDFGAERFLPKFRAAFKADLRSKGGVV